MSLAIEVAEKGLHAGEMPIGALVLAGGEVISRAFTQEQLLSRKVVHADLMAMLEADKKIGLNRSMNRPGNHAAKKQEGRFPGRFGFLFSLLRTPQEGG
ncbi:tRNA-specific adenosine deaminase, partial [Arthrobacter sp. TMT4-20]